MSSIVVAGDTSGSCTLSAPAVAGSTVITLPVGTSTMATTADVASSGFPSGTRMSFQQTAAPTGWTKDTTAAIDDSALRFVTGSVVNGGSVAFSTAFASQAVSGTNGTSGATTLTTSQVPNATGSLSQQGNRAGMATSSGVFSNVGDTGYAAVGSSTGVPAGFNFSLGFGGGSHTHSAGSFTGTAINLAVKYYDFIIASRN